MNTNEFYKLGKECKEAFWAFEKMFNAINETINVEEECNEEMIVYKKCKMMVHPIDVKVGDQIEVPLNGIGTFIATAHQITDEGILFIFDDCIARMPMKLNGELEVNKWLYHTLYKAFPESLRKRLKGINLPSYGQLFGHDEWYEKAVEPDKDEQLPLMKIRKNRICTYENNNCWYWLKNATKEDYASDCFAAVDVDGFAFFSGSSLSFGVRPAFLLG